MKYTTIFHSAVVVPEGTAYPLFAAESATYVELVDEGGGPFIELVQFDSDHNEQKLRFDFDEFKQICEVIDTLRGV